MMYGGSPRLPDGGLLMNEHRIQRRSLSLFRGGSLNTSLIQGKLWLCRL